MKFWSIVIFMFLLTSCKHPMVGKRIMMGNHIEPEGHHAINWHEKNMVIDYDYRVIDNEIEIEGIFTCSDDTDLLTWERSHITLYFIFQDVEGIVQDVEQTSITTDELCAKNHFKATFPFDQKFEAIQINWRAHMQAN